jgi:hypothetical protein
MLVANGVVGDSRVQKAAWSMAAKGWEVTLVGRAPGDEILHYRLGAARVVLVPVPKTVSAYEGTRLRGGRPPTCGRTTGTRGRRSPSGTPHPPGTPHPLGAPAPVPPPRPGAGSPRIPPSTKPSPPPRADRSAARCASWSAARSVSPTGTAAGAGSTRGSQTSNSPSRRWSRRSAWARGWRRS